MPKYGVIIADTGAHLIVNHALITNSCDNCMWQGIEARGQVGLTQNTRHQGWVTIRNGSTVEHAIRGVSNTNTTLDYAHNVVIIQCENSTFRNNQTSAAFYTYDNYFPSGAIPTILRPNLSYFNNCKFLLDDNYKGNIDTNLRFYSMVWMRSVEGIKFAGCNFINKNTYELNIQRGDGIYAVNSGFQVLPICAPFISGCSSPQRSKFTGFRNGINIKGSFSLTPTTTVDMVDFDSCGIGVFVTAQDHVSVTECTFKIGRGVNANDVTSDYFEGCFQNVGILSRNSSQFRIEGNNFKGVANTRSTSYSNQYSFGTIVANEPTDNTVYRNQFDSLTRGILAIGHDWFGRPGYLPSSGLRVTCNQFGYNNQDLAVHTDGSSALQKVQFEHHLRVRGSGLRSVRCGGQ
jgi:hypothetical protein